MSSPSISALSNLINDAPLQPNTFVEILRFRKLASGNLILKTCENLEDDVIDYLASERIPDRVGCATLAMSTGEAPKDAPYLQFMYV
jgi:hypothetical protein